MEAFLLWLSGNIWLVSFKISIFVVIKYFPFEYQQIE